MRLRSFDLPTLLALAVVLVAVVACGSDTAPGDDAPSGGGTQVGSTPSPTGTTTSDSEPDGGESADETSTATPVAQAQDSSRMSPGDYLEICGLADRAFEGSSDESFGVEELAAGLGDVIELFESVQPLEEFADWHEAMAVYLKAVVEVVRDAPGPGQGVSPEEAEDYAHRIAHPVGFQHLPGIFEIIEGMDPDDIEGMVEAGCVGAADVHAALSGEESREPGHEHGDGGEGGDGAASAGFVSVSAGGGHTCSVTADGSVACWGHDGVGQSTPPDGEFVSVSAGTGHTCGLRTDGMLACWGDDSLGQATPPDGEFVSVYDGWYASDSFLCCGVSWAAGPTWSVGQRVTLRLAERVLPPPELQRAAVHGSDLTLIFDQDLNDSKPPTEDEFHVTVNGERKEVWKEAIFMHWGKPRHVVLWLDLDQDITHEDPVRVRYTRPPSTTWASPTGPLESLLGDAVESFDVQVETPPGPPGSAPVLESAVVSGKWLTLTFDLDLDWVPWVNQFQVQVTDSTYDGSLVSGGITLSEDAPKEVKLELVRPVLNGETVVIEYTAPIISPLRSKNGDAVWDFDEDVTNLTP